MQDPQKSEQQVQAPQNSNKRFFVIVIVFIAMLIGIIAFEVATRK